MGSTGTYRIRPAGRHLLTIGRDLIQDPYAAVIELVKNSYDADSPDVIIEFIKQDNDNLKILISDSGHGMTRDVVINKWMVPSTDDKQKRRISPKGRIMQGCKGIGRYASAILGNELLLNTISEGQQTTLFVNWDNFESAEYLDDVEVLIETTQSKKPNGTTLEITGGSDKCKLWTDEAFSTLCAELRKLKSPIDEIMQTDPFEIMLQLIGFSYSNKHSGLIDPIPILDFYDYRIKGKVTADGEVLLTFSQQKFNNQADDEVIRYDLKENDMFFRSTGCGDLVFNISVFDREKDSIELLIKRGLRNENGSYLGNIQARRLLNEYNGIVVYRNGFRVRPLGDPGFDWLGLDSRRVQNPTMSLSSNQVIGYVTIQSEQESGLIEKSARDGLRDNLAFESLKKITKAVLSEIEERRYRIRKRGMSSKRVYLDDQLTDFFSFDDLKTTIRKNFAEQGIGTSETTRVLDFINSKEVEKLEQAEEIRQKVAIYQNQASLGMIMNVVLHEGRRSLGYFINAIPLLKKNYKNYCDYNKPEDLEKILKKVDTIIENMGGLISLFAKIEPFATGKRGLKKSHNLKKVIEGAVDLFTTALQENNVKILILGDLECKIDCWQQDIAAIFANLIENSIYWMCSARSETKEIRISIKEVNDQLSLIDFVDTGPGIDPDLIIDGSIFDAGFSRKPDGSGLGLAIAGEAATRNGLRMEAIESDSGVHFQIKPIRKE